MENMRAYLRWKVEEAQAEKEWRKQTREKVLCVLGLMAMAALWIAGWVLG